MWRCAAWSLRCEHNAVECRHGLGSPRAGSVPIGSSVGIVLNSKVKEFGGSCVVNKAGGAMGGFMIMCNLEPTLVYRPSQGQGSEYSDEHVFFGSGNPKELYWAVEKGEEPSKFPVRRQFA